MSEIPKPPSQRAMERARELVKKNESNKKQVFVLGKPLDYQDAKLAADGYEEFVLLLAQAMDNFALDEQVFNLWTPSVQGSD